MTAHGLWSDLRSVRPSRAGLVLGALAVLGVVVALVRFASGIGAISHLSNTYSWGLWISLDLLCGVALGAGAFTMASIVYILDLKDFRPILRPSILTGFLGYGMVIVALLVDLGRPERIWHMMIYQNGRSVLLEVGLCVMLYTTVLALEFLPVLLEPTRWARPLRLLHAITLPLVILGVVLSTLHQSSLGSLFLIMPAKLNPLWYSPLLPLFFFLTALAVGLAMVIFESLISARVFRRGLELHLLSRLGKAIPYILGVYLALKLGDLALNGKLSLLFALEPPALLFWLEVMMGSVAPIVVFSRRVWRETPGRLLVGALLIIAGVMLNRFNVSLLTMSHIGGQGYVPSLGEWAISLGIISAGVLAFAFVARFFPLFDVEDHAATHPSSQPIPTTTGA
jgi:Ni/Fe-hydrogenase subunit HybB-like protein